MYIIYCKSAVNNGSTGINSGNIKGINERFNNFSIPENCTVVYRKKKSYFKALFFEHRLRGISLHLKDRQVGKEKIEGLGFTSQMSMDLLLMEMEKLMAKDHSGGTFAQMWVHNIFCKLSSLLLNLFFFIIFITNSHTPS